MINPKILEPDYADQFFDNGPGAGAAISDFERGKIEGAVSERLKIKKLLAAPEAKANLPEAIAYVCEFGATEEGLRAALAKSEAPAAGPSPEAEKPFDPSRPAQAGAFSVAEVMKIVNET